VTRHRDDWYRRTTWTKADQQAFFARNKRSRGSDSKAQYIRIQSQTLLETGKLDLILAAARLLEQARADFPSAMDRALALETEGRCCEALGRVNDAIELYRCALQREREFPGIGTNSGYRLAKLIVETGRTDLYGEAAASAEFHGAPVFPWHAYMLNGVRAIVASRAGAASRARSLAKLALDAASVRDTGLSHGRGHLGTVKDTGTTFHKILMEISDA
jgi:hypothetical protein